MGTLRIAAHLLLESGVFVGLMLLGAALFARAMYLRRLMTVREAAVVAFTTRIFWGGCVVTGLSHGVLWFSVAVQGGRRYVLGHMAVLETVCFLALVLLEIWPSRIFRSWRRFLVLEQAPWFTDAQHDALRWGLRVQIALLVLLPLLEPLVGQGGGSIGP